MLRRPPRSTLFPSTPLFQSETGKYHDHFQCARRGPPVICQQIIPNHPKGLGQKTHRVIVKDKDMLDKEQRRKEAKYRGQGERNTELKAVVALIRGCET